MIEVYASITDTEPSERYDISGITVSEFLASKSDKYKAGDIQPFSCTVNGEIVKPSDWCNTLIGADDRVLFHRMPESDVKNGLGFVLPFWGGSVFAANKTAKEIFRQFTPDMSSASMQAGEQGNQLTPADAKANIARAGSTILQGFGRYLRYGDYLTQPRRYWLSPRVQVLEIFVSLGWGDYDVDQVRIGDSDIAALGGIARVFKPDETVVGAQWWYTSPNVGGTQSTAGIRLQKTDVQKSVISEGFQPLSQGTTLRQNSGNLPDTWVVGDTFRMNALYRFATLETIDNGANTKISEYDLEPMPVGTKVYIRLRRVYTTDSDFPEILTTVVASGQGYIVISKIGAADSDYYLYMGRQSDTYKMIDKPAINEYTFEQYRNGVKVQNWGGFYPATNPFVADIFIVSSQFEDGWTKPIAAIPKGATAAGPYEVDVFFPQGLGEVNEETGDITPLTRTIQHQVRLVGASAWGPLRSTTITDSTRDQIGHTIRFNVASGSGQYEIRVRRVEKEINKTSAMDTIEWTGLKTYMGDAAPRGGELTKMRITVTNTEKIASSSENRINAIVTRKLPAFTGGAPRSTRSIADAFHYVAKSMGYTDSEIDMVELSRLNSIWESRGDTFDYFFSETTVKDAMDSILNAGMAALTVDNGVLRPVRDEPRTVFEQGYSPENMTNRLRRSFAAKAPDEFDGVEVEYTSDDTFTTETVLCLLPGDNGSRLDKIKLMGVTNRTRAWRIGMRARRSQKYRRWTYDFATEMDALNSGYLSYVPLVDDVPGYGAVSLMRSVDATKIVVDEPLEWQAGKAHVIAYRANDGKIVGPFACTKGSDNYTALVSIPAPLPMNYPDREPIHVYFGTAERWSFPALITEINPQGRDTVSVTATNYDVRVYADDNNSAP